MRETLIVIGLVVLAVALRSARTNLLRKLGALTMLAASAGCGCRWTTA